MRAISSQSASISGECGRFSFIRGTSHSGKLAKKSLGRSVAQIELSARPV